MMSYIDQFYEDVKANPPEAMRVKPFEIEKGQVFMYSRQELLNKLHNIENMRDEDVFNMLSEEYSVIFSEIFESKDTEFFFVFESPRFISIITQVISTKAIPYNTIVHINSFLYNYLMYVDYNENETYLRQLLFMFGEALNKKYVSRLLACGLTLNCAIFTVISLNSSFVSQTNVKRMNFTLATCMPAITKQQVIDVYECLFESVTDLIVGTLFDRDITDNYDKDWVTPDIRQADINITTAIALILESLTPFELTKVLQAISYEYKWRNYDDSTSKIAMHDLNPKIFVKTRILMEQLEEEGFEFP